MKTTITFRTLTVILFLIGINVQFTFAQDGFTAKDLSTNPVVDGSVDPATLGFESTISDPAPTITYIDGVMRINCAANQTATYKATNATSIPFQPTGDYTIEFRAKVPANNGRGFDFAIRDGVYSHSLYCLTHERFYLNTSTVVNWYLDAPNFHTYRFAVKRSTGELHVWIDGVYKGLGTTVTATSGAYQLLFGKSNASAVSDIYLDYLTFDLTGAYKPNTILLEEPDYSRKEIATTASLDGTVLPDVAGWTITPNTGSDYSVTTTDGVFCIDCPAGNQYGFQSSVSSSDNNYTIEFRAKTTATTGRGMDVVIGSNLYCLTNTKFYNNNEKAPISEFTDSDFKTIRMVGSGTGKYVDVWVDDKYMGVTNTASANKFQFGKTQTAATTTFYLDYVSIDTSGKYKPVNSTVSIEDVVSDSKAIELKAYTNKDNSWLYLKGVGENAVSVKIIGLNGQIIQQINNYLEAEPINISYLNKGVYLLQVSHSQTSGAIKFIKY